MTTKLKIKRSDLMNEHQIVLVLRGTRIDRLRHAIGLELIAWACLLMHVGSYAVLLKSQWLRRASMICDCGKCGNACAYVEPYGWVPECGCPVHDPGDGKIAAWEDQEPRKPGDEPYTSAPSDADLERFNAALKNGWELRQLHEGSFGAPKSDDPPFADLDFPNG